MNAPKEVKEYFDSGSRRAVDVRLDGVAAIIVHYEDGASRRKDMAAEMTGIMECLKDESVFATVHLKRFSAIAWDTPYGEVDIDADAVYLYGEKVDDPPMKIQMIG